MSYALVICNHGPYGAGNSGGTAGLKYGDFTFEVSRQCRGMAGLLIPAKTAGEIAGRFDRGLPVYSTVFYPNFGRVLKYREIRDFEKKQKWRKSHWPLILKRIRGQCTRMSPVFAILISFQYRIEISRLFLSHNFFYKNEKTMLYIFQSS